MRRMLHAARRYWTVALDSAQVSGQNVALGATTAILDSGTTAILVGPDDAAAIHAVGEQLLGPVLHVMLACMQPCICSRHAHCVWHPGILLYALQCKCAPLHWGCAHACLCSAGLW